MSQPEIAGLFRRLASLIYDIFLVLAIWIGVAGLTVFINNGEALPGWAAQFILFPLLLAGTFLFYYWFWTHGGQTLGMRAWQLKLLSKQNKTPTFKQCSIRFVVACASLGTGMFWCLFKNNRDSLQCMLSGTHVVLVAKEVY